MKLKLDRPSIINYKEEANIINYKEEEFYVSCCPELGLIFKGKTVQKTFDGLYRLIQLQFPPPATFPSFFFCNL